MNNLLEITGDDIPMSCVYDS